MADGQPMASPSTLYSHSRLSAFENCPYQYKLRYIDKVKVDDPGTIEQFLGSRVHDALEWLYDLALKGRVATEEELQEKFEEIWEEQWDDRLRIVRDELDAQHYREVGLRCVRDYHRRHHPFDSGRTLGLELRVMVELPDGHRLQGYIDRLEKTGQGHFVIPDYKTSGRLPEPTWAARDRQLALYALAIRERFPEATADNIQLAWHYVAFDEMIISTRTGEQLDRLAEDTARLIETVEQAVADRKLPTRTGTLCEWCEYQPRCPEFAHRYQLGEAGPWAGGQSTLEAAEISAEAAGELVDRLAEAQARKKEAGNEEAQLKERLIEYGRQTGHTTIYGAGHKVNLASFASLSLPAAGGPDRALLESWLKGRGYWEEVVELSAPKLKRLVAALRDSIQGDPELATALERQVQVKQRQRVSLRKR